MRADDLRGKWVKVASVRSEGYVGLRCVSGWFHRCWLDGWMCAGIINTLMMRIIFSFPFEVGRQREGKKEIKMTVLQYLRLR